MAVYAFSDGISKAMPYLVFPIVAWFLTPDEFGLVTNFGVLCQVLFAITLLNTHTYLSVEYYKRSEQQNQSLILNLFYLGGILLVISLIGTLLFSNLILKNLKLPVKWQLYALIWVGTSAIIYIFQAKLRLDEKAKHFGAYQIGQSIISAGLTLLFVALLKLGWQGRINSLVITNVLVASYAIWVLKKTGFLNGRFEWKQLKSAFYFGIPLLPHTLSFWLKGGLDNIYITAAVSIKENGIYAFAGTLASIFFMLTNAFFSAYNPYLFKTLASIESTVEENKKELIKIRLLKQAKYFILLYAVANVVGYFIIRVAINLFFLKSYGESLKYIPWLQLTGFFGIFYAIFSSYIFYMKSTKILGAITISTAVLQAGLNYFAVIHFGVMGIIIVGISTSILMAVLVGMHSNKVYPMPWKYLFNSSF
jgi:O-antigen/teichoic acid export membrane protein